MNTFAERVRARRQQLDLSQTDLAKASGMSQSTVAYIERGRFKGSRNLLALADVLGTSVRWLSTGKGPMEEDSAPATTLTSRQRILLELFEGLTESEQEEFLRAVQGKAEKR